MTFRCCLINATKPKCVTKEFSLVDGKLEKKTIASVFEGSMQVQEFENASQFAVFLQTLSPNQCLTYGIPPRDAELVTEEMWINLGQPDDPLPRTQAVFGWHDGPGILMLDYDAPKDGTKQLGAKELINTLLKACPDIKSSNLIWWPSTSSLIYAGDTKINGLKGQRIYLFVKDANDIARAGKTLNERLWAIGYGRYEVSESGSLLMRNVFDGAVWQSNRIDFAAGAMCGLGLEQRRGKPTVLGARESFNLLDTRKAIPALSQDEADQALANQTKAKGLLANQAELAKAAWLNERVKTLQLRHPELDGKTATMMALRAIDSYDLMGDWSIFIKDHDGQAKEVSVTEILDSPDIYNGKLTLDPLEPEYDGGRWVGKLFLKSPRQSLNSFAHGGVTFRLHRQPTRIEIVAGKGRATIDALLEVLRQSPDIFDFGEELVRIGSSGGLHPLNEHSLRYVAGGIAQFFMTKKLSQGGTIEVLRDPSNQVCLSVLSLRAHRELKKLNGVITAPTLRPDGSVLDVPGYDLKTLLLYDSNGTLASIPTSPSRDQALAALEQLWLPFDDFPFCSNLDRAVHLAALLTTSVRSSLPSAPGFAYDAPIQGSGKTLLARCIGVLAQGIEPSVWPHTAGRDDEEVRKRIFTILRSGSRVLIWDNVVGTFDSSSMASCMTSPTMTDRILGQSNSSTVPNRMMVILTGNNLTLQGEMPRRILVCRIDPRTDKPFARSFDLDPYVYCRTNRLNMITAALTLIRAFLTHGCETNIAGRLASFEDWDSWVRRAVIFANELKPGMFGDVMDVIQANQSVDPDQEALSSLLASWEEEFGTKAVTVSELLAGASVIHAGSKIKFFESLEELTNIKRHQLTPKSVGRYLSNRKGRIANGRLLERGPKTGDLQTWRIKVVGVVNASGI